jgi:DNA-binding protein YbaB
MTGPESDAFETAELMKNRLNKIKENPERALFSVFKGTSRSGSVTATVDLMGRLKNIHLAPNTLYEGGEQWLSEEIASAYQEAQRAASFLDFDLADLAAELENTPNLRRRVEESVARQQSDTERERARRRPSDDDDWFEGFNPLR